MEVTNCNPHHLDEGLCVECCFMDLLTFILLILLFAEPLVDFSKMLYFFM